MDALEYQKKIAEFDERIAFHKAKANEIEHQKAVFNLNVMTATHKDRQQQAESKLPEGIEVTSGA